MQQSRAQLLFAAAPTIASLAVALAIPFWFSLKR
jgi:hypothetical protein